MYRKTLSWVLAFIMIFTILGGFSPENVEALDKYIIDDDFESDTVGDLPDGWIIKYNGDGDSLQEVVTGISVSGDNSFKLDGASSWSATIYKNLPTELPDSLVLEAYVRPASTGESGSISLFNKSGDTWGAYLARLIFGNGKIYYSTSGHDENNLVELQDYSIDTWYHVKLVHDLVERKFDIYIDGAKRAENVAFYSNYAVDSLVLSSGNASGTNLIYYDDIKLYYELPDIWGIEIESTDMYPFGGGDGSSEAEAFEISTANQLSQLAYNVNKGNSYSGKYFKLTGDIDLSAKEWVPIGSFENNYFDGYFDGNNKTIEGLEIGSSTQIKSYYAAGLFGVISSNSVIENLNLLNVAIYSNSDIGTGALVGYNNGGEIDHCGSSGNINAYSVLGGLVGRNTGNIYNSYSRVNLTSDRSVSGGFVGDNTNGIIYNSYATGNVVSGAYPHAGGFVGYIYDNSIIQNCYATGDVSGSAWGYIGGFYGRNYSGGLLTNTYWNQDAQIVASEYHGYVPSIHGSSQNCLGISESEMKSEGFASLLNSTLPIPTTDYYNWDIQEGSNQGFPVHSSLGGVNTEEPTTPSKPSVPRLEIETEALKDGVENEEYELQVEGDGGKSPYIWSAEGLPKGLSISEEGMISGTPEEDGDFSVKLELLDSRNYYRSGIFSLKITKDESKSEDTKEEDSMEDPFSDIDEHWAKDYIKGTTEKNLINGYPDGTFKPDNNVTREEFASLLVRALQLEKYSDTTFEDVVDRWSTEDISTAAYYEIIKGYDENKFGPEDFITREQMAVMVARALDLEENSGEVDLNDIQNASNWARNAIISVVNEGLIEGYPDGSFRPMNNLTRAEAVKVIYSIMK